MGKGKSVDGGNVIRPPFYPFLSFTPLLNSHLVSHCRALGSSPGVDATCDYVVGSLLWPDIFFSGIMVFLSPVSWGVLSVLETVKRFACLSFLFIYVCYLFVYIFFQPPAGRPLHTAMRKSIF